VPLTDILSAALSRPAGKVVDGPVRVIVDEVLRDKGFAGPAELRRLQDDLASLRKDLGALTARVGTTEGEAAALRADRGGLEKQVEAATARAAAAEKRAQAAESALAEALELAAAAETHAAGVAAVAAAAEERARLADDRAKVALNRTRQLLEGAGTPADPVAAVEPAAVEPAAVEPAAVEPAAPEAAVAEPAVETGPAPHMDPTAVGPAGEVLVDGVAYRVDASHAGKPYEVRGTRSRRVRIEGRFVRKTKV
jgi:hypothetical protein